MRREFQLLLLCLILFCFHSNTHAIDNNHPIVRLETNLGIILLELDREKAPKTVENFLIYVKSGFYNNTIFHRVIDGFMIQGGGITADFRKKATRPPVENEANNGLHNVRGTVAMARTGAPHSASSQFFINVKDNNFLDFRAPTMRSWGYAVFGKVIEGMDVVDKIRKSPTGPAPGTQFTDVPKTAIIIVSAAVEESKQEVQ